MTEHMKIFMEDMKYNIFTIHTTLDVQHVFCEVFCYHISYKMNNYSIYFHFRLKNEFDSDQLISLKIETIGERDIIFV